MHRNNKKHRKVRKWRSGPNFSGQHLLHQRRFIRRMVELANIGDGKTVLDLGAGKGAITLELARKNCRILAVENDPAFAEILRRKLRPFPHVSVMERDILQIHWPKKPFHVVASIPYAITTPILGKLLDEPASSFLGAVLLIEYGAAKRFTAKFIREPRLLQWRMQFDLKLIEAVPRTAFFPQPKVDSAILRIQRKADSLMKGGRLRIFAGLAEHALQHPGLPVQAALRGIFTPPQMKRLFPALGLDRDTPVGLVTETQWSDIFRTMLEKVDPIRWPKRPKRPRR